LITIFASKGSIAGYNLHSGRKTIDGMEYLDKEKSQGFYLHPSYSCYTFWIVLRSIRFTALYKRKARGIREERKQKSIEEKESLCWLKGYHIANEIALSCPITDSRVNNKYSDNER
jgi:hypothetical protein